VPVKGAKEVSRNFKKLVGNIAGNISERTLTKVLITGAAAAARITPVDTANLINSQFRRTEQDTNGWIGQVGYTAAYAVFVHNGGEKSWQKAAAEALFLQKGFERDGLSEIINIITREYKV
jgi:hypothetical protein